MVLQNRRNKVVPCSHESSYSSWAGRRLLQKLLHAKTWPVATKFKGPRKEGTILPRVGRSHQGRLTSEPQGSMEFGLLGRAGGGKVGTGITGRIKATLA